MLPTVRPREVTGTTSASATLGQVTGIQSSAFCASDMTLSKSHVGNFTRGSTASYTIPISNVSLYGATSGVVTMNDTLPIGITPTSATGTGWSCSVSGQTVSCVRSDAVARCRKLSVDHGECQRVAVRSGYGDEHGHGQRRRRGQLTQRHGQRRCGGRVERRHGSHGFSVSESGGRRFQHHLHAGRHQQRSERRRQCALAFLRFRPTQHSSRSTPLPDGPVRSPESGNTGTVVCTNANMAGGTSGTFTMIVKVNTGVANGTVISDTVSVASSATDPIFANNSATATTVVGGTGPNLSVTDTASPNPVQAGTNITYTQVVTNTGIDAPSPTAHLPSRRRPIPRSFQSRRPRDGLARDSPQDRAPIRALRLAHRGPSPSFTR